jgi:hypothetical protein
MRLILHIGRHKSGTSSIQHWLKSNCEALLDYGVIYPLAGRKGIAHHELASTLNPKIGNGLGTHDIATSIRQELNGEDTILISSEAFQNIGDLRHVRNFIDLIGPDEVEIICFFREHIDYCMSGFRQMIQNQTTSISFYNYTTRLSSMDRFIESWEGIGDLKIDWMTSADGEQRDSVKLFLEACDLISLYNSGEKRNLSIGGNLLVFKAAANKLGTTGIKYRDLEILASKHSQFSAPFFLDDAVVENFRASSDYNASLIQRLGPVFMKTWGKFDSLPNFDTLHPDFEEIGSFLRVNVTNDLLEVAKSLRSHFQLNV